MLLNAAGIDDGDQLDIALAQHDAAVAGAERHHRAVRRALAGMTGERRELEAEPLEGRRHRAEVAAGDADMVEAVRAAHAGFS